MKLFILASLLLCVSCLKIEDPIGDHPVSLTLDLTFNDKALKEIPSYKIYSYQPYPQNMNYRGFGYGGVLVVHGMIGSSDFDGNEDHYFAFDLACPYEANRDVLIEPDADVLFAVCPKCKSRYEIFNGTGYPSGVSQYGLKKYRVDKNGDKLIIRNL